MNVDHTYLNVKAKEIQAITKLTELQASINV
jgi:hypothetical protein